MKEMSVHTYAYAYAACSVIEAAASVNRLNDLHKFQLAESRSTRRFDEKKIRVRSRREAKRQSVGKREFCLASRKSIRTG